MFLNKLTLLEKESFISLGVHAANANGFFDDKEYAMIEEYCKEMGIAFFDARKVKKMEEIINVFRESANKKMVLFEVLGLLYADGSYDDKENVFVQDFAKKIGLSSDDVEQQNNLIVKYLDLVKEIFDVIK